MNKKDAYRSIVSYNDRSRSKDDYLEHQNGFKYIDRFFKNGRWNYIYEEAKGRVKKAKEDIEKATTKTKSNIEDAAKKVKAKVSETVQKTSKDISKAQAKETTSGLGTLLLAGAAILGVKFLASTVKSVVNSIKYGKLTPDEDTSQSVKDFKEKEPETLADMKKLGKEENPSDSVTSTNPDYPDDGSVNNCIMCSMNMEMRARGYDTEARKRHNGANATNIITECFPDAKREGINPDSPLEGSSSEQLASMKDIMASTYPPDSRGVIQVIWKPSNGPTLQGHAIYWKNEGGTIVFYDGQSGKSGEQVEKAMLNADLNKSGFYRLDNLEMNDNVGKYVVSKE